MNVSCGEDSWVWEESALQGQETWKLKESLGKMPGFREGDPVLWGWTSSQLRQARVIPSLGTILP